PSTGRSASFPAAGAARAAAVRPRPMPGRRSCHRVCQIGKDVCQSDRFARRVADMNDSYDVVVVGGGAAGLNGALMLARSRRSVLVIDAGEPRNAPAHGVHGLLGREGMPPAELLARGRAEVRG